ncbi:hypothetical protein AAFF_G00058220 [Aldrovandia affinis]|uniref:Uncharacterized protein n=1 Tax=Aldrovandia affinis TaxID=143900 RepID=A0AAD7S0E9_9TELE|nr:hypothetical protein AAFF_G00058220 [Aldrovandia affinis]
MPGTLPGAQEHRQAMGEMLAKTQRSVSLIFMKPPAHSSQHIAQALHKGSRCVKRPHDARSSFSGGHGAVSVIRVVMFSVHVTAPSVSHMARPSALGAGVKLSQRLPDV